MTGRNQIKDYNYDSFVAANFEPLMRFDESPRLGAVGPNFPLWSLADRSETTLLAICAGHVFTVVEFGSFT